MPHDPDASQGDAPHRSGAPSAPAHPRRRYVIAGVVALAVVVAGVAVARQISGPATVTPASATPPAIPVSVAVAVRADVPIDASGLGTVQAFNTVTVRVRVDGELQKVNFTEGQDVKAGDLLAEIDPRPFQATLGQTVAKKAQDEAQLANARHDLERYLALAAKQDVARQTLDTQRALVVQLEAAVKADDASIQSAQVQLGYTRIAAPISGRVGLRLVDAGNMVHATDATGLVVIAQVQPISVIFTLPQDKLAALQKAAAKGPIAATALAANEKDVLGEGTVAVVDNQIDQTTGTIRVKATFPNADRTLWPGQYVKVRVRLDMRPQVVTIPSTAVQRGAQGQYAYVVGADGKVVLRWLKIDDIGETIAVVTDGVAPGERVVTAGHYRLKPGLLVKAQP